MKVATILAYTSPALGHLLPMSALLSELSSRGHRVHVRTLSTGVEIARELGLAVEAIDPRIEAIVLEDGEEATPRAALKRGVATFGRRAVHEVADLGDAVARVRPDALLVDVNCWGALSAAEAGDVPWACFCRTRRRCGRPGCHRLVRVSDRCRACWAGCAMPPCALRWWAHLSG